MLHHRLSPDAKPPTLKIPDTRGVSALLGAPHLQSQQVTKKTPNTSLHHVYCLISNLHIFFLIPGHSKLHWVALVVRRPRSLKVSAFSCDHSAQMIRAGWSSFLPAEKQTATAPARGGWRYVPIIHGNRVRAEQPWLRISWWLQQQHRWIGKSLFSLSTNQSIIV